MLRLFFGDYKLQKDDLVIDRLSEDTIRKNFFNKNKNLVGYSDELGVSKDDIEALINRKSPVDLTLVIHDRKLIKGRKKGVKKYDLIIDESSDSKSINPFELGKLIFSCRDRNMLFEYLKESKNSLFILMRSLACNSHKLSEGNRKTVEWLCKNYFRVKYEIVCAKIAFHIKCQQIGFLEWLYPKKKEEE